MGRLRAKQGAAREDVRLWETVVAAVRLLGQGRKQTLMGALPYGQRGDSWVLAEGSGPPRRRRVAQQPHTQPASPPHAREGPRVPSLPWGTGTCPPQACAVLLAMRLVHFKSGPRPPTPESLPSGRRDVQT